MRKSTSRTKDQQDGGCLSAPKLLLEVAEDSNSQAGIDWLAKSESALLFEIAECLQKHESFDSRAIQLRMPSPLHWAVVKRHIDMATGFDGSEQSTVEMPLTLRIPENSQTAGRQISQELQDSAVGASANAEPEETRSYSEDGFEIYKLADDPLGHAYVDDFSVEDMDKLRALAHLELAVQFEKAGHSPVFRSTVAAAPASPLPPPSPNSGGGLFGRRSKSSSSSRSGGSGSGSGWFGVPLESVLATEEKLAQKEQRQGMVQSQVPQLVTAMIDRLQSGGLKEEGILRISGSVAAVRNLRARIEASGPNAQELAAADPHDVAGLLKAFLRDLPRPLLSGPYVEYYRSLDQLPDMRHRLIGLNLLVILLPPAACQTLRAVVELFRKVLDHKETNRMSIRALATVMTPSLLPEELTSTLGDSERSVVIVELLIAYKHLLWRVPTTLVRNLRTCGFFFCGLSRLNDFEVANGADEAVRAEESAKQASVDLTLPDGKQLTINLASGISASGVLNKFVPGQPGLRLFELGGNIKRRRLAADAQLLRIWAVNPKLSLAIG